MKLLIVTLCLIVAIAAQKGGPPSSNSRGGQSNDGSGGRGGSGGDGNRRQPPSDSSNSTDGRSQNGTDAGPRVPFKLPAGCENAPNGTKLSDCCKTFPNFYSKEVMMRNCSAKCRPTGTNSGEMKNPMCCSTDCALEAFGVLTDGAFDSDKLKVVIQKLLVDNPEWTAEIIDSIVDVCTNNVTERVEEMIKGFNPNCSEKTTVNMVIGQCIRRELFFQCPNLIQTDQCSQLVSFGKKCPVFPFHDGCGDKKQSNESDQSKNGGKPPPPPKGGDKAKNGNNPPPPKGGDKAKNGNNPPPPPNRG